MTGLELVAGYVAAWAIRRARHIGERADAEIDRASDALLDRLHDLVTRRLDNEPAVPQLEREAVEGIDDVRTKERVTLAVEHAIDEDPDFRDRLCDLLEQIRADGRGLERRADVTVRAVARDRAQMTVLGRGTQNITFGTDREG